MRKRVAELRVRIDEGIHDALKEIAKEEGRTVSELVREAVAWLVRDKELIREIESITEENASLSGQRVALMRGHIMPGDLKNRKRDKKDETLDSAKSREDN